MSASKRVSSARHTLVEEIGLAMQRYQRSVQSFDDAVGVHLGVGPADLRCLDWLADGAKTAGELSTATGLSPASTTALIDRLARKGFVERVRNETDRRQVLVQMTQSGQERTWAVYGPLVQEGVGTMADLTDDELAVMRDHLDVIRALTDKHRATLLGKPPADQG